MHRSGTSALARVLALAGCALPKTLFEAVAGDNDLGYWESRPLIEFHEGLFHQIGTTMLAGEPIDPAWFESRDARRAEDALLKIVRSEWSDGVFASRAPWLVKEPRIARLMPLWRRVLARTGRRVVVVHMLREPAEVAASLLRRPELTQCGFTQENADRTWLEHVLLAERHTRDLPRTFASIDLLMGDWRTVVARVGALLPVGEIDVGRAESGVAEFLQPALRHHRVKRDRADGVADAIPAREIDRVRAALFDSVRWGLEPDYTALDDAFARLFAISTSTASNDLRASGNR
jgi:hypothetical protein